MPALAGAVQSYELAGWASRKNLHGAPYDWRRPISTQLDTFVAPLKSLIENVSAKNGAKKVVLMGVSFGPQNALGFLHRMTQAWKDKYISWFVALSPVWSGSTLMLQSYVSGLNFFPGGGGSSDITKIYLTLMHATPFAGWTFPRATRGGEAEAAANFVSADVRARATAPLQTPAHNHYD